MKFALPLLLATLSSPAFGAAYSLTQVIQNTVGTTAAVTGSGDKSNTATWTEGVVGRYLISDGTNTYGLAVTVNNPTGALTAGTDSLMVARTVNSQGLTDAGTLSIYFNPDGTGTWSADVRFSFFNVDGNNNFTTSYSPTLLLTSLDIDFGQRYYTDNADFSNNLTYSDSKLTSATPITGYTGFTDDGDASFSDPRSAVSSSGGSGVTDFDVRVSHDGVALFMFEFRDPSQVLVPEPSTALLGGLGALALLRRRR